MDHPLDQLQNYVCLLQKQNREPSQPGGYDPCLIKPHGHLHQFLIAQYLACSISLENSQYDRTSVWNGDEVFTKTTTLILKFHVGALLEIMIWPLLLLFLMVLASFFHRIWVRFSNLSCMRILAFIVTLHKTLRFVLQYRQLGRNLLATRLMEGLFNFHLNLFIENHSSLVC